MLLILSRRDDEHVRYLLPFLRRRALPTGWIDTGDFPGRATVSLGFGAGVAPTRLRFDGAPVPLHDARAVWLRYPLDPDVTGVPDAEHARAARTAAAAVIAGLSDALPASWLPARPREVVAAQRKVHQLTLAPTLGFRVPRTRITNDPTDLLEFWEACEGRMVAKSVSRVGPIHTPEGTRRGMPTHVVRRRDLAAYRTLRHAPMILQEYVPKRLELRVTVVGERAFTCAIDSQASRVTRHDWRHDDPDRAGIVAHALEADVAAGCVRMLREYGLRYGAIDLVLTPSGEHVFLEINPMGEWVWAELAAGLPIADAIADALAGMHAGDR